MSIYEKVLRFIHSPEREAFEGVALEVFRHQFASVTAYRKYCLELGVSMSAVRSIDDIPAVSNAAFKHAGLSDESIELPKEALTFLTSGTTQGRERRGRHVVPRPEIYRASAIAHLRTMLFPDYRELSRKLAMIGWCITEFGSGTSLVAASSEGVDTASAINFLSDAEARREPVCIMGTTAAFAAIVSAACERGIKFRLSNGTRLMDTGGAKGQAMPMQATDIVRHAGETFGIAPAMVINEYGMTELCSQLYDATAFNCADVPDSAERFKIAPPWLRVSVRDPVTQRRVADGEVGLLTFFDLANVGSVSAVMTEDLGIVEGGRVRVIGRSAMGAARGCALAIGQFADTSSRNVEESSRLAR